MFSAAVFVSALAVGVGLTRGLSLTHSDSSWPFRSAWPPVLKTGQRAWYNSEQTYTAVPLPLIDASFWPGLNYAACPTGTLTLQGLELAHGGVVYVWFEDRGYNDGGLWALADDATWTLLEGSMQGSEGYSGVIYAKAIEATMMPPPVSIPITSAWAGGLAFKLKAARTQAVRFSLSWGGPAVDTAHRRMQVGRSVFHDVNHTDETGSTAPSGSQMMYLTWSDAEPDTGIDQIFQDAFYWPGFRRNDIWDSDIEFRAAVSGTFFALDWQGFFNPFVGDNTSWEFLGLMRPTAAYVYARSIIVELTQRAPEVVKVAPASERLHITFAFRKAFLLENNMPRTDDLVTMKRSMFQRGRSKVPAVLMHSRQVHGELTETVEWQVGVRMWAARGRNIVSLPDHLRGALSFLPALPTGYGPNGTLTFEAFVDGSVLFWHAGAIDDAWGDNSNEAYLLDKDSSSGWSVVGTVLVANTYGGSEVYPGMPTDEVVVYGKRVSAGAPETFRQGGRWTGGVAFVRNTSLVPMQFPFALSASNGDFDDVPRRFGPSMRLWTDRPTYANVFSDALENSYMFGLRLGDATRSYSLAARAPGTAFLGILRPQGGMEAVERLLWMPDRARSWAYMGVGMSLGDHYSGGSRQLLLFGSFMRAGEKFEFAISEGVCEGVVGYSTAFNLELNLTAASTSAAPAWLNHTHWSIGAPGRMTFPEARVWASGHDYAIFDSGWPTAMKGSMYWPSLDGRLYTPPGTLKLTTTTAGAAFAWAEAHGGRTGGIHLLDDDAASGWKFFSDSLCSYSVGCFNVYAKNMPTASVVEIPYSGRWSGGVGFVEAQVDHPAEKPFSLSHPAISFDDVPRRARNGAYAWTEGDMQIIYAGISLFWTSWFWPGLRRASLPTGALVFSTRVEGTLFVWPASGWGWSGEVYYIKIKSEADYTNWGKTLLGATKMTACSRTLIDVGPTWEGGVAFATAEGMEPESCPTTTLTATSTTTTATTSTTSTTSTEAPSPPPAPSATVAGQPADGGTPATRPEEPCCAQVPAEFAKKYNVVLCDDAR